jgi:hypothetical protein
MLTGIYGTKGAMDVPDVGSLIDLMTQAGMCMNKISTAYLLLFTLVTSLATPTPPLSRDRRGLLHVSGLRGPRREIEARRWARKPRVVPKVAGVARRSYQIRMRRKAIWCQKTPVLEVHQYKSVLDNRRNGSAGRISTCTLQTATTKGLECRCRKSEEKFLASDARNSAVPQGC